MKNSLFGNNRLKSENMTFWQHLDALRNVVLKSIFLLIFFSIIFFIYKDFIFENIIVSPSKKNFVTYEVLCILGEKIQNPQLCLDEIKLFLINYDVAGQLRWHLIISFASALVISFPFIILLFWNFVKPALLANERKHSSLLIFNIVLLFYIGLIFGFFLILPITLQFLVNYELNKQITNYISINSYISTVLFIPISTAIVFELPALIYFISKIGLITASFLKKYRKHSFIVILIISAVITPSTDAFTMLLLALPIYMLYEISILICKKTEKKKS